MRNVRRTKADLCAELEALRHRLAEVTATAQSATASESALRRLETRYHHVLRNARALIVEFDARGTLTYMSPGLTQILGHRPEDVRKGFDFQWVHANDRTRVEETYRKLFTSGQGETTVYRARHKNGHWVWLETSASAYRSDDGATYTVALSRDVTQLIHTDEALHRSKERFRVLARTSHDLVTELDGEGHVLYVSPNCREVLGYAPDELIGSNPFPRLHADDLQRGTGSFQGLTTSVGPVKPASFRVLHSDGSYRWLQCSGVTYLTADGEFRLVAVSRDVTEERREADERGRLEQKMQQAQKLEGLGVMAGGIAHDFNNLLTPILGEASLALTDLPPESPLRPRLDRIVKAADRAAALTRQMLAYAGTESLEPERLDLSGSVREMAQLIESAATNKAVLEYDLREGLPAIEADAAQLSQVALNLVSNASEALGEGTGRIAIRTGALEADRAALSGAFPGDDLSEGTYVYLEVADTGCGMEADTRARIFDPFFTTKFTGRGLGLAAVLGIVRAHHGVVEVYSAPGTGTRVRVLFPTAEGSGVGAVDPIIDPATPGRETVLIIDDDESVAQLASEMLERAGFDAVGVSDAHEAIATFRRRAGEIGVVLLDRTMPELSGEAVFEELRRIRPDTRIVLLSGYTEESAREAFAGKGLAGFVHKPFQPATLVRIVRTALVDRAPEA
jgi:PAS domain S-box-containing protein